MGMHITDKIDAVQMILELRLELKVCNSVELKIIT